MTIWTKWLARLGVALSMVAVAGGANAADDGTIRIGGLSTLAGPYAEGGKESMRGIELALAEFDYQVAGKRVVLVKAGSDGNPDRAVEAAQELIDRDQVDIVIGPLSGDEGLAIKEYAKTRLDKTFINGASAAQDATLRDPAPNFYRFSTDGAQWIAGLGAYAHDTKQYKNVAVIAEDYSFTYTQVFGFMHEFCSRGGHVVNKFWVPLGEEDFTAAIFSIPPDVDAVFVALGGKDALDFLTQYHRSGIGKPLIGSSLLVDRPVLNAKASFRESLVGLPSAMPSADANPNPEWLKFVERYRAAYPEGSALPSLFATLYYIETKAALLALKEVKGDLSDGQAAFRTALNKVDFEAPTGRVFLDENRNAVADIFVTEVDKAEDGSLYNRVVNVVPGVAQTLGMDRDEFLALGPVGRNNPECP